MPKLYNNHRLFKLHYIILPVIIFIICFDVSVLNTFNTVWLRGDLAQAFLGWEAYRHSPWQWPVGMSSLIAHPHGAPIIATDSNPLLSFILKPFSTLLPSPFQFQGWWYLISIALAYAISFNLLKSLTERRVASILGAAFIALAPIFIWRWAHNSLVSHWIILAAFSIFLGHNADRTAIVKYSGLHALAIAIHPYFLPMIFPTAGMDLIRRAVRRRQHGAPIISLLFFLTMGLASIMFSIVVAAWLIGMFGLGRTSGGVGDFSMDPFAWFNPIEGTSLFFGSWQVGPGQYEGYQYLGLGGMIVGLGGLAVWLLGAARQPARLTNAALWLAPAFGVWFVLAVSTKVTVFGHTLFGFDAAQLPVIGDLFSAFRSSGRLAWPITYFLLIFGLTAWICSRPKSAPLLVGCFLIIQLLDISPLIKNIRHEMAYQDGIGSEDRTGQWKELVLASEFVYFDQNAASNQDVVFTIGSLAFPNAIPLNRFYMAHGMSTRVQEVARTNQDARVMAGELDPAGLYVIGPPTLTALAAIDDSPFSRLTIIDEAFVLPPVKAEGPEIAGSLKFAAPPANTSLYALVDNCGHGCSIAIAVRDEATNNLSPEFMELLDSRGGSIGELPFRGSYAALLKDGRVIEEAMAADHDVVIDGEIFELPIEIASGGNLASNTARILLDGIDLSPNERGINLIMMSQREVSYMGAFDTFDDPQLSKP